MKYILILGMEPWRIGSNVASDERYWNQFIRCLLKPREILPAQPEIWNRWGQSSRNWTWKNNAPPPTPPSRWRKEPLPPSPPPRPRNRIPTPWQALTDKNIDQDYYAKNFGRIMYDSLKVLVRVFGASETEVKVQFWAMSRIYHPEKHKTEQTGMTKEDATTLFNIFKDAHSYLK